MRYPVSNLSRRRIDTAARRANLRNPRVWQDSSLCYFVSGTDSKDRRITIGTKTVRGLVGVLHDARNRGCF